MRDVITALVERAETAGESVFCHVRARGQETTFTCRDALRRSAQYANLYRQAGLKQGSTVVIILKHAPDLYFSFLGAMLAGCAPSFMPFPSAKQDPELYWSQHQALFARIGVDAVVTYPENAALLGELCPELAALTPDQADGQGTDFPPPRVEPQDIAFLQHSSGTTGLKKGVLLSFGAVAEQIERYAEELQLTPDDVVVSWLPLYHDMGLIACFMLPLTMGIPFVSLDAFEWVAKPDLLFTAIDEHRGTHVWLPNFAFHHLCRTVPEAFTADLSCVKAFIDCSEPCRRETLELFADAFARLGVTQGQCRICYAMAETVFCVTQTPAAEGVVSMEVDEAELGQGRVARPASEAASRSVVSVGRPIRGVSLQLVDDARSLLPEGRVGEVAVQAPFLFSGYHRDPKTTAGKLDNGWYYTGDLGFMQGGELYLLGRTDDLIILNGRNVFAHHVEFAINAETPEVKAGRCIALGLYSEAVGSQELIILAEAEGADPAIVRSLSRSIKSTVFNGFGVMPKEVKVVPPGWLTKTTSGKIARDLNLRKYLAGKQPQEQPAAT